MTTLLSLVSLVLLLFLVLLVARAVLDWSTVLAGPVVPGTSRWRIANGVNRVTEPILAPVRRVIPPLRFGGVGIDLSFIVVFLAIVFIRRIIGWI